jgi:Gluconate 2-dehydrogenase subunit 3
MSEPPQAQGGGSLAAWEAAVREPAASTADSRREFLRRGAAAGAFLLTFLIAGREQRLTAAQARASGVAYRTFTAPQVRTLEALGEVLVPGSAALGLVHFIDQQVSGPPADSMLMIKYLGVSPPFAAFYTSGVAAVESAALSRFSRPLTALNAEEVRALVMAMAAGTPAGWSGPPAPLFYFVLRNDAVDVTYGTPAGFERLGVPYMAHIAPPARGWSE